jgi:molecular chaperone GrpE
VSVEQARDEQASAGGGAPAEDPKPLEAAQKQAADYYDQLVRLKAEFENYRKRSEKEKADARRWGKEEVLLGLISLMDVVSQAEAAAQKGSDLKAITAGLHMLYGEFKRLLKDEGIEEIAAEGRKFDPAGHEAVETSCSAATN